MILLGSKVKDKVTGFEGIVVSRVEYLNGCIQYGVKARYVEEEMQGKMPKVEYIDEMQLEDIPGETVWIDKKQPGGDQADRPRR